VSNDDRKDIKINVSKLYRIYLEENEYRIRYLYDTADQDAIFKEFREWFEDSDCEIITSKNEYMNLTHSNFSNEIQSKTYFAQFRFCYDDNDYYKWYAPF